MDEQEENRTKMERATHDNDGDDDRCQRDSIPFDLALDILSRLPPKSIARSLCVSKLWSSFTTLPSFTKLFATRRSALPPSLLVTFSKNLKRFVFSFPQHQNPDGSYPPAYIYQMTNEDSWFWNHSESVHGLVLIKGIKGSVIWNPTMRRFTTLPSPTTNTNIDKGSYVMSYLGYDPLEDKHKVLCVSKQDSEQPRVLTLGAQESWRVISKGNFPLHSPIGDHHGQCINGILYYDAYLRIGDGGERRIMSFDVRSEKFTSIKLPDFYSRLQIHMIPYKGRVAIVKVASLSSINLWILKDGDRHIWKHKIFVLPLSEIDDPLRGNNLSFSGVSDAGELIFTRWSLSKSFYILYFDLRSNSIREALFEGIVGDDFRCRYGLDKFSIYSIDVFPNHIESLMSL
ncbi:PREDICTED: putative F-box protein At1g50870 [Camelina sativa]|uniref:F-box protein At1g50870 n=1 Tax=Camelina sativa TaxID=90675 RepID=A0ABM0Y4D0_CAMSA|nr:PREDICTED: putative F-box protein At1g50870 [Camelina sativa]